MGGKINSKVVNILIGTFFTRTALFMTIPFLIVYLTNEKEIPIVQAGYILAVNPLVNVIFSILGGALVDKMNIKTLLIRVPFIWGIVCIGFFFADTFLQFFLLNALSGLCYTFFEPASKKMLSNQTPFENRLLVFNLRYMAINIGRFLGPILSLFFNIKESLFPYLILGCVYIIYSISIIFNFRDLKVYQKSAIEINSLSFVQSLSSLKSDKIFIFVITGVMFSYFGLAQFNSTISQYLNNTSNIEEGTRLFSLLLSFNAALILIMQYFVLRIIKKVSPFTSLMFSNVFFSIGLFIFGNSYSVIPLLFAVVLFSLAELLILSRIDFLMDELAEDTTKGMYFGASEISKIGNVMGPIAGGYLLGIFGYTSVMYVFIILSLITLIGSIFINQARKATNIKQPAMAINSRSIP